MPENEDENYSCSYWIWSLLDSCLSNEIKPCGIRNSSGGCFMNSVIHAIASSGILIEKLEQYRSAHAGCPILNNLLNLIQGINHWENSNRNILLNTDLHEKLVQSAQLNKTSEKDAFKWMQVLFNTLEEEWNNKYSYPIQIPLKISLIHRFDGLSSSDTVHNVFGLSLELSGRYATEPGVELEYLIYQHFLPKVLKDGNQKYNTFQRYFYQDAPQILLVHIIADRWNNRMGQLVMPEYHIRYSKQLSVLLNILHDLHQERIERACVDYQIKAVIYYTRDNSSRHKVTYRVWENEWYLVNNRQVKRVEFRSLCPHILIFEKCNQRLLKIPFPHQPSGLRNNGSSCYMNAILQAVASSDILIEKLQKLRNQSSQCSSLNNFLYLIQGLNETGNVETNSILMDRLMKSVDLSKTSEQDAFDWFSAVIQTIAKDISAHIDKEFVMPLQMQLLRKFRGIIMQDSLQNYLSLSLNLCGNYGEKPGVDLESLVEQFFQPSPIDNNASQLTQMFIYQDAPDVLVIHIQANKWDSCRNEMIKPDYHIICREQMKLEFEIASKSFEEEFVRREILYRLRSMVQHMGTVNQGHYITYRHWQKSWYLIDDEKVTKVEFSENISPYILIYDKII